jgi:DNA-binding NarL/FixJ family response regulator
MELTQSVRDFNQQQGRDADERQRPIIAAMRAGDPMPQIAERFRLSRSRVHQIRWRAMKRGLLPSSE